MTVAKAPQSDSVKTVRSSRTFHIGDATLSAAALDPGLYVVATPIGNLADVTLRALAILAGADAILAEDTRVSRALLARYGIERPLSAYHEPNAAEARPRALKRIAEGQALALISDAGTPLISDPGYKLVAEAIERGFAALPRPRRRRGVSESMRSLLCPARSSFMRPQDDLPRRLPTLPSNLGLGPRRSRAN